MNQSISLAACIDRGLSPVHLLAELEARFNCPALSEDSSWQLSAGKIYWVRRGGALIAWRMPLDLRGPGFKITAAHTDSPHLRIRSRSIHFEGSYALLGTEVYGGPILSTWLDRELMLVGQIVVRTAKGFEVRPCALDTLRLVIPNLAIHLNRDINKGFEYNPHEHLRVVLGGDFPASAKERFLPWLCEHHLNLEPGSVVQAELQLCDAQPASIISGNLIHAPRLDNLAGCHAAIRSFMQATPTKHVQVLALFDHEEIGSRSRSGADSSFFPTILERIVLASGGQREDYLRALASSTLLSVDAAHAIHPAYPTKHDADYAPILGGGIVIKANVQHKYATGLVESAHYAELWKEGGLKVQYFSNRADSACGSTIGPLAESLSGLSTLDIGIPLWAMHSVRETAHVLDQETMIRAIDLFYGEA